MLAVRKSAGRPTYVIPRRREALFKDPEWLKYLEMNAEAGYLLKQESKLMSPAPFAPIKR